VFSGPAMFNGLSPPFSREARREEDATRAGWGQSRDLELVYGRAGRNVFCEQLQQGKHQVKMVTDSTELRSEPSLWSSKFDVASACLMKGQKSWLSLWVP